MPTSHFILLIELDPHRTSALAAQLVRMGIEPVLAADLAEAKTLVRPRSFSFSAVLIPGNLPPQAIDETLRALREVEAVLPAMAYGKTPDPIQRKHLRQAGVHLALWDGYDDTILRFQINRLIASDRLSTARTSRRAPMVGPVVVLVGGREKPGTLFSVSEGGCFVETSRASMDGARVRVQFAVDGFPFDLAGTVAFANVPGNLQRPNLPLGMGISFDAIDEPTRSLIGQLIEKRLTALDV